MPNNSRLAELSFLCGNYEVLCAMQEQPALPIFSDEAVSFLTLLSSQLLKRKEVRKFPDIATFAYWCRRASLAKMREGSISDSLRLGRGVAFHIAPSNVPVNFAYSLAVGLLAGNANIVKPPSRDFKQVTLITEEINNCLQADETIAPYLVVARYDRQEEISGALSALCDVRVIWGGDATVNTLRAYPLKPRATDITFPNRHSLLVIDAEGYLALPDKAAAALAFYNDTFLTDQNACSSPRLIAWLGKERERAKQVFWQHVAERVQGKYELQDAQAVKKLTAFCLFSAQHVEARLIKEAGNLIYRVALDALDKSIPASYSNSGYFFEYDIKQSLAELLPLLGTEFQTLSYCGMPLDALRNFIEEARPRGVDRIVPIGKVMDFTLEWDGYDLIRTMSRVVSMC